MADATLEIALAYEKVVKGTSEIIKAFQALQKAAKASKDAVEKGSTASAAVVEASAKAEVAATETVIKSTEKRATAKKKALTEEEKAEAAARTRLQKQRDADNRVRVEQEKADGKIRVARETEESHLRLAREKARLEQEQALRQSAETSRLRAEKLAHDKELIQLRAVEAEKRAELDKSVVREKASTKERVDANRRAQRQIDKSKKAEAKASKDASKQVKRDVDTLKKAFNDIVIAGRRVGTQTTVAMKQVSSSVGKAVRGVRTDVTSLQAAIAIGAVTTVGTASVKKAGDFETGLAKIGTILPPDTARDDLKQYRDALLKLNEESAKDLLDITEGAFRVIGGLPVAAREFGNVIDILTQAVKTAEAGGAGVDETVRAFLAVLNSYSEAGLTATQVSDKFFATINRGNTNIKELAGSVGNSAAAAAKFGITIDELLGGVATLTTGGQNARASFVALTGLMNAFIRPGTKAKEAFEKAAEASGHFGFEAKASTLKQLGLVGVLEIVNKGLSENVDGMAKAVRNIRGMRGAAGLTGAAFERFKGNVEAVNVAVGDSDNALTFFRGTLNRTTAILGAKFTTALVTIGEQLIPGVIKKLNELAEAIQANQGQIATSFKSLFDNLVALLDWTVKNREALLYFFATVFVVPRVAAVATALYAVNKALKSLFVTANAVFVAGRAAAIAGGAATGAGFVASFGASIAGIGAVIKAALVAALSSPLVILAMLAGAAYLGQIGGEKAGEAFVKAFRPDVSTKIRTQAEQDKASDDRNDVFNDLRRTTDSLRKTSGVDIGDTVKVDGKAVSLQAVAERAVGVDPAKLDEAIDVRRTEILQALGNSDTRLEAAREKHQAFIDELNSPKRLEGLSFGERTAQFKLDADLRKTAEEELAARVKTEALFQKKFETAARVLERRAEPALLGASDVEPESSAGAPAPAKKPAGKKKADGSAKRARRASERDARRLDRENERRLKAILDAQQAQREAELELRSIRNESAKEASANAHALFNEQVENVENLTEAELLGLAEKGEGYANFLKDRKAGLDEDLDLVRDRAADAKKVEDEQLEERLRTLKADKAARLELEEELQKALLDKTEQGLRKQAALGKALETGDQLREVATAAAEAKKDEIDAGVEAAKLRAFGEQEEFERQERLAVKARARVTRQLEKGEFARGVERKTRANQEFADERFGSNVATAQTLIGGATSGVATLFGAGSGAATAAGAGASALAGSVVPYIAIAEAIKGLLSELTSFITEGGLSKWLGEFVDIGIAFFEALFNDLPKNFDKLLTEQLPQWIEQFISKGIPALIAGIVTMIPKLISSLVRAIPLLVVAIVRGIGGLLGDFGKAIADGFKDAVNSIGGGSGDQLSQLITSPIAHAKSVGQLFTGRGSVKDLARALDPAIFGFVDSFSGGGTVRGGVNSSSPIAAAFSAMGAQRFADGGTVRGLLAARLGADTEPALLAAGEGVVNREGMNRIGGEAGLDAINRGGSQANLSAPTGVNIRIGGALGALVNQVEASVIDPRGRVVQSFNRRKRVPMMSSVVRRT